MRSPLPVAILLQGSVRSSIREEQPERPELRDRLRLEAHGESGSLEVRGQQVDRELLDARDAHMPRQLPGAELMVFADDAIDIAEPLRRKQNRELRSFAVDLHQVDAAPALPRDFVDHIVET